VLRYKHVESPSDSGVSWHGVWVDQFGNLYRRTLIYHPGFWNFVLRAEELKGMRMEALKFYLNKPTETGGRPPSFSRDTARRISDFERALQTGETEPVAAHDVATSTQEGQ
jgi:hypothetical protein